MIDLGAINIVLKRVGNGKKCSGELVSEANNQFEILEEKLNNPQLTKFTIFELFEKYFDTAKMTQPEYTGVCNFRKWLKNNKHL